MNLALEELEKIYGIPVAVSKVAISVFMNGCLLNAFMSGDMKLIREIARIAQIDPPPSLARTNPKFYKNWRDAVTRYHLEGWSEVTPERIERVLGQAVLNEP